MDVNDLESCRENADELQQQQQQEQSEQNEVVPSSEMSIGNDNELTTIIAEHQQLSTDIPSIDVNYGTNNRSPNINSETFAINSIESNSDGGAATKSESDTESESRLVIQSENETNDNDSNIASAVATTTIKENGGSTSPKQSRNKRKTSDSSNKNDDYSDDEISFSDDSERFAGFDDNDTIKSEGKFIMQICLQFFSFTKQSFFFVTFFSGIFIVAALMLLLKRVKMNTIPESMTIKTIEVGVILSLFFSSIQI